MSHDLDALAQHAADQTQHEDVWSYGNDTRFSRAVARFAARADRFHERIEQGLSGPSLVSNANHLAQDARYADEVVRRANSAQVQIEWQEAMRLVGQIQSLAR